MKSFLSILLSACILMTFSVPVVALTYDQMAAESVTTCTAIGMVLGTGNGVTESYLNTEPMRYQGAALLLRLKGLYNQAVNYTFTDNYYDYHDLSWTPEGHNMTGYIYDHEYVGFNGYPDGSFKPMEVMSAKQYYKLMLVSLGYTYNVDFVWDSNGKELGVMDFAASKGLTWLQNNTHFTIRDLCIATNEALKATVKNGSQTLAEQLIDAGVIVRTTAEMVGLVTPQNQGGNQNTQTSMSSVTISINKNNEMAVALGETIINITLSDATFTQEVGTNHTHTDLLIAGLDGDQNTASSWDNTVVLTHSNVTRLNDSQVEIRLSSNNNYRINGSETLTLRIPTTILSTGNQELITTGIVEDSGSGTSDDPWRIVYEEDLQFMNLAVSDHYSLMNNLDFTGKTYEPISVFRGTFHGNGHTINSLSIDNVNAGSNTGIFSHIDGATIGNLNLNGITLNTKSTANTGIIAGQSWNNAQLYDIHITNANIQSTGGYIGGIIGSFALSGNLSDCTIDQLTIYSPKAGIGGIAGSSSDVIFDSCSVTNLSINPGIELNDPSVYVGGIIGQASGGGVNHCTVNGDLHGSRYVGGIIGLTSHDNVDITNCEAYGTVIADSGFAGGILGSNDDSATVTNNHAGQDFIMIDSVNYSYLTAHRIVSNNDTKGTILDNTANTVMQLLDSLYMDHSGQWISDRYGNDGENDLTIIPLP